MLFCRHTYYLLSLAALLNFHGTEGLISQPSTTAVCRQPTYLAVTSQDVSNQTQEADEKIPYVVARGDGSEGGGGLSMPKRGDESEDKDLRRPKVGAEMPKGRPSWFRVPGPSQGEYCCCHYYC